MRITRVYTKSGDTGQTRLVGGQSISKDDKRIEAYGTVDELNAIIGLTLAISRQSGPFEEAGERIEALLTNVQNDLFSVGAELACLPSDLHPNMHRISTTSVEQLERWCDELNESLPPLTEFILPGGGMATASLHQARTVCRRSERRVVAVEDHADDSACLVYLNRLSDLLFVMSRWVAHMTGEAEVLWDNPKTNNPKTRTD